MRRNFIFSLQQVLDLRRQQEEKSKEALALAMLLASWAGTACMHQALDIL